MPVSLIFICRDAAKNLPQPNGDAMKLPMSSATARWARAQFLGRKYRGGQRSAVQQIDRNERSSPR
jgi:hypothetical protein